jgi:arginyl-tRNA synthetase
MSQRASTDPVAELRGVVQAAVNAVGDGRGSAELSLERPPKPELGDYSTNAAMLLAPVLGEPPRDIAQRVGERLEDELAERA